MYFPISLAYDLDEYTLLVTPSQQSSSVISKKSFLKELYTNLDLITHAAKERFAFRNSSSVVAGYLGIPETQCFITTQWGWKIHTTGSGTVQGSLSCMIKLIRYLQAYGSSLFPSLFVHSKSIGNKAIERALHILTSFSESASIQIAPFSSALRRIPSTFSQIASEKEIEVAKILISLSQRSDPLPLPLQSSAFTLLSHQADDIIDSENEEDSELQPQLPLTIAVQEISPPTSFIIPSAGIKRKKIGKLGQDASKKRQKISSKTSYKALATETVSEPPSTLLKEKDALNANIQEELHNKALPSFPKELQAQKDNVVHLQQASTSFHNTKNKTLSKRSAATLAIKKSSKLPVCIPVSIFSFEKSRSRKVKTFNLHYASKYNLDNNYRIKVSVIESLIITKKNIELFIYSQRLAHWSPSLTRSLNLPLFTSRQEVFVKILQGVLINKQHLTDNHPWILPSIQGKDPEQLLNETIALIKQAFHNEQFPLPNDEELLQETISAKALIIPQILLKDLETRKRIELSCSSKPKRTEYFTYLFSIYKKDNDSSTRSYTLRYVKSKSYVISELTKTCRQNLLQTLSYIDEVLASALDDIIVINPKIQKLETKRTITSPQELLKCLLEGLMETQLYLNNSLPSFLQEIKNQQLCQNLQDKINFLQTKIAIPLTQTEATIIPSLIKSLATTSYIPLNEAALTKYTIRQTAKRSKLTNPYLFIILPVKTRTHCYRLRYTLFAHKNPDHLHSHCRTIITDTIKIFRKLLEKPSGKEIIIYENPQSTMNPTQQLNHPYKFWPIILQGLLETKLFYLQHVPDLLHGTSQSKIKPLKALENLIEDIKKIHASFCKNPIETATILPKLMGFTNEEESNSS